MYQKIDENKDIKQPNNSHKIKQAYEKNQLEQIADNLYNVFENVIEEKSTIQKLKEELTEQGALR